MELKAYDYMLRFDRNFNSFGSLTGDASVFLQIRVVDLGEISDDKKRVLFEVVEMDFEKDLMYSITFQDSKIPAPG